MGYTTADLLTRAKLYAFYPSSNGGPEFTDSELLQLADDDLRSYLFPRLLSAAGEYAVKDYSVTLAASTSTYRLPPRAHLGRVRDVLYVKTSGERWSVPMIDHDLLGSLYSSATTSTSPERFYLKDGSLCTFPAMGTSVSGSLNIKYYCRPSTLVATSACSQITTIGAADSGGAGYRRFTCANVPTSVTTSVTLDHVRATGGFEVEHLDLAVHARVTGASGTIDLTETAFTVANIAVGDYLCLSGESCVPQLPDALHPLLARRLAVAILEQLEPAASARAQSKADELEREVFAQLQPRVDGEDIPFINPYSALRQLVS